MAGSDRTVRSEARRPWVWALRAEAAFPSAVRGPEECCALLRLASICFSVDILDSFFRKLRQLDKLPPVDNRPHSTTGQNYPELPRTGQNWENWSDLGRTGQNWAELPRTDLTVTGWGVGRARSIFVNGRK